MKHFIRCAVYPLIISILCMCGAISPAYAVPRDVVRFEKAKEAFREGFIYFNRQKYLAAVEHFRKAVSDYPGYLTAREYLARSYRLAGFKEEAIREWEAFLEESPDNVLVQQKIDALRFQDAREMASGPQGEFVLADEVSSEEMRRYRFPNPVDFAIDNEKNMYITSFSSGKLIKIDPNKDGLEIFNAGFSSKLYGIDYFNGRLAVADFGEDMVYVMSTAFKMLNKFGSPGNGEGSFHGPQGVCFDPRGFIYVADSGNHRVQKFGPDGRFILSFGRQGEYEGELYKPTDVTVAGDAVYVSDNGNNRIACFDDSGNFVKNITIRDSSSMRGIRTYGETLLIADEKTGLIVFNPSTGKTFIKNSWERDKRSFSRLFSAAADRDDFLYCLDYGAESLLTFNPLAKHYTNFDVEIASVDVTKYPVIAFYVSVRDRAGKPLYGLKKDNFRMIEDKVPMSGLYVDYLKDKDPSASMVFCVDRSEGMRQYHGDVAWVAEFILQRMRTNDSFRVASASSDYVPETDFDWSRRRALAALGGAGYGSGKNLGKALYNSITDLVPRINRRGVILLTDGEVDEKSFAQYTADNIIFFANSHHVPVYIISFRERSETLEKIASATGGAFYFTRQAENLKGIYEKIRGAEENRYVLVYSTLRTAMVNGWWSEVKIEVSYKNQKGHEWGGYFVP
jgi:VWFA-related protein